VIYLQTILSEVMEQLTHYQTRYRTIIIIPAYFFYYFLVFKSPIILKVLNNSNQETEKIGDRTF